MDVSRAVAATQSPRSSAAIVHSRPKPRDAPVMNQTFSVMLLLLDRFSDQLGEERAEAPPVFRPR